MKTRRKNQENDRPGLLLVVLLVLAFLITLLPGRSEARVPVAGTKVSCESPDRSGSACRLHSGHVPNRAPAYREAGGCGCEGRIDRIPPRPGRGRRLWVPGRFEPVGFRREAARLARLRAARERGYCECDRCRADYREIETRTDRRPCRLEIPAPPPNPRPHRAWVWVPGHWERI